MYMVYKYEGTNRLLPMRSRGEEAGHGGGGEAGHGGGGGRTWGGNLTFFKNVQSNSLPTSKSL